MRSRLLHQLRERLRAAVVDLERAQCASDPSLRDEAVPCEPGIDGRLTPIDRFESQGRRYIVAVEVPRGWSELSPRERDVVRRAIAGASNKEIARDLELAHATVRVMLHRAAAKLKARNRKELVAILLDPELKDPS
jgi:DNA-binding CsgD family transcriptional regulator